MLATGTHEERLGEFADVLAWLCTIANVVNVDLAEAMMRKYGSGCPGCGQFVCRCAERRSHDPRRLAWRLRPMVVWAFTAWLVLLLLAADGGFGGAAATPEIVGVADRLLRPLQAWGLDGAGDHVRGGEQQRWAR